MILGSGKKLVWNKRTIGYFVEENRGLTLILPRRMSHKFRIYNGWGIGEEILEEIRQTPVIKKIRVVVRENGKIVKILETTPEKWWSESISYKHSDFESQRILPEEKFQIVR